MFLPDINIMNEIPALPVYVGLVLCVVALAIHSLRQTARPKNFPPGPTPVPLLGNLNKIPARKQYLVFHSWTQKYGSIIGLKFGPINTIVLNHWRHVVELVERRGTIYNSRPANYIGDVLVYPNQVHLLFIPYNSVFKMTRKAVQALLAVTRVDSVLPIQEAEATQTMVDLATDPDGYYDHFRRYATAVVLACVYGQRAKSFHDPKVETIFDVHTRMTELMEPGSTFPPLEVFPWARYLPEFLVPWKKAGRRLRRDQHAFFVDLLEETRQRLKTGISPPCLVEKLIREQDQYPGLDDEHLVYVAGMMMEAGSDTTSLTLLSFILALIKYPHVLGKAQEEVDRVCGTRRSPTIADAPDFPYLDACIKETIRWRPVAPLTLPHSTTQDDTYEGYFIPKDTMVFINAWALHRDPDEYYKPDEYIPERFLKNTFGIMQDRPDDPGRRVNYAFGAGRRICAGQHLAENSLILNVSKLVWAFDIKPAIDPTTGEPVFVDDDPLTRYTNGILTAPKRFPVSITPRSPKHVEILQGDFERARELFRKYET